jgi:U3 small nucleolar RNA-associated protein 19
MSGTKAVAIAGIKRKRVSNKAERRQTKSKPSPTSSEEGDDPQTEIARLESQLLESRKHYNNIVTLLQLAKNPVHEDETSILAAVALCRVFARLLSSGDMVKSKGMVQSEALIVSWLKERYREYISVLLDLFLRSEHAPKQSVALTLLIRLVKEESKQKDYSWKKSPLPRTVETVLLLQENEATRDEFAEKYFTTFDDIRFYTFQTIR